MRILFLTLSKSQSVEERGIYTDLLRTFRDNGHQVTIVSPTQRREGKPTRLFKKEGVELLKVKTFNITKTNLIEKGIGTILLEYQFLAAIKKYLAHKKFDLVLYCTPPITFAKVISYIKKRDNATSYLLLKDIFPQNAVDLGMFKEGGVLHKYFKQKERRLYDISDTIGCMSEANKTYVLKHNPEVLESKVEVNPNTIDPQYISYTKEEVEEVKRRYNIPTDKTIFVYGGNLGAPQGIAFLIETIAHLKEPRAHILVVGSGTKFNELQTWFNLNNPTNATLLSGLPRAEYDALLAACDIGLIFLHKDFTIPNFPSRLLAYLEMKMPVLAATDVHTDIGEVICQAGCGYWVEAGDLHAMQAKISDLCSKNLIEMGEQAWRLLNEAYLVDRSYRLIIDKVGLLNEETYV